MQSSCLSKVEPWFLSYELQMGDPHGPARTPMSSLTEFHMIVLGESILQGDTRAGRHDSKTDWFC